MNGEYLNSNFVLGVGTKKGEQILARRDVNMEYGMPWYYGLNCAPSEIHMLKS